MILSANVWVQEKFPESMSDLQGRGPGETKVKVSNIKGDPANIWITGERSRALIWGCGHTLFKVYLPPFSETICDSTMLCDADKTIKSRFYTLRAQLLQAALRFKKWNSVYF